MTQDTITPAMALEAVLLFHAGGPWSHEKSLRWAELTGSAEATTRTLCDAVRAALLLLDRTGGALGLHRPRG